MQGRLYNEYIKVEPDFIPVFSKNSDKVYPNKWQSFYPHSSFKNLLKITIDSLEKSSETKDRSIWISGAYGTGKTFASFVIKHILEDNIETISPYFINNGMETLLAQVNGIRAKGRILVVQRSGSAGIDSQDKLFNAIIESVRKALADAGLAYSGAESLSDKILTILKNPETSAFNFEGVFKKYRGKFTQYSSTDGIIKDLEELDPEEKLDLLDTIIEVAALEGFNWSMSSEEIVDWLDDVRRGNNLYSILFIWDEFTEYFRNNPNNITGLQEIAQASSRISFYFLLITHGSSGQLIQDKGSRTILEARFKLATIELEDSTAFKLLGQALMIQPDLVQEWEIIRDQLWVDVKKTCFDVIKDRDYSIQADDFVKLLPMHPYTAYLLKFIAKDVSSNQRTIFQFLSGDYSDNENKTNFKWFIDNFSYDYGKWNYLTVDYLWNYFFQSNNADLDSAFIQSISHYNNFAPMCDDPTNASIGDRRRRVLKAALLLASLQVKNSADAKTGTISLMRPTQKNIQACFAGTPQESSVDQDLSFFESKGILGKIESAKEVLYVTTSITIDNERMNQVIEETRKAITFEKLIDDPSYDIAKQFLPTDYLKARLQIVNVSPHNARQEALKIESSGNRIPTFYLFAKNEAEQSKIKETVDVIFETVGNRCIVVDFSGLPFTENLFEKFIESKAKEKYFSTISNQKPQYDLAKKTSVDILNEWTRKLVTTSLNVYACPSESVSRTGGANLRKEFKEINSKFYGCGLEEISQNDKLFAESGFRGTVAQMAMGKIDVPNNYSYVRNISNALEKDGIWGTPKYWEVNPLHPVSKMKILINEIVEREFAESSMVSVEDIWSELKSPPFGLMPNTGSVFLLGFLLGEFADSSYYKKDQNNVTVLLDDVGLSDLILGVVKDLPKAKGQFIVKQTPEQKEFCEITGDIFKIPKEKRNSLDDIATNINIFLTINQFPLWAIRYFINEEMYDHEYCEPLAQLTSFLCEFIKPESKVDRDRVKVVDDIYNLYKKYNTISEVFSNLLTIENMRKGMTYYIGQYKPELIQIASKLKIEEKDYLELLTSKLSDDASYLWEIGDTNRQIDNLYTDLKLIYDINRVLTTKYKTYSEVKKALDEKLNIVKIPYALLKELKPELMPIIDQFNLINENSQFNKEEASTIIANMADDFVDFFNNQFDTFCKAVNSSFLNENLTEEEYEYLFDKVPSGTLFKTIDSFNATMHHEILSFRKSKKTQKMHQIWEKTTSSSSPADWSKKNGIPILCLFTDDIVNAQKFFGALNETSFLPTEKDIDDAIEFFQGQNLNILKDKKSCEQKFIEFFAEDYAYVITSVEGLRDQIRAVAGSEVYDWYAKASSCKAKIREFAKDCYQKKFCSEAKEKIRKLEAEEAQKYLDELIDQDPLLGIRILKGE